MMSSAPAAAGAAAAIAQAIKASGVIVRVEPNDFLALLAKNQAPLVVISRSGFFSSKFSYLTSYKGLAFFTRSSEALQLPGTTELIEAQRIWVPH